MSYQLFWQPLDKRRTVTSPPGVIDALERVFGAMPFELDEDDDLNDPQLQAMEATLPAANNPYSALREAISQHKVIRVDKAM